MKANKLNAYTIEMDDLEAAVVTEAMWLDTINDECLLKEELQENIVSGLEDEREEITVFIDDRMAEVKKATVDTILQELNNIIDPLEERSMICIPIVT